MWARVVEGMLACWLAVSPFVFQHGDQMWLWLYDFGLATLVATFAMISYWPPARYSHLLTAAVALWMIGFGRIVGGSEMPAALQNHMVVGLLLAMFALVPNHAASPPRSWYENATP